MLLPNASMTSIDSVFLQRKTSRIFVGERQPADIPRLPRSGRKCVRLRCQCTDGAEIDHVTRQLRHEQSFDVGADDHFATATRRTEITDTGHFVAETNAACTMDASIHARLHQWSDVLVLDRSGKEIQCSPNSRGRWHAPFATELVVGETTAIATERHGLILQIAFTTLIADRTVQRMIDQ